MTPLDERDLVSWIEYSNAAVYRRDVLRKAHTARLLEYNQAAGSVTISPLGIQLVFGRFQSAFGFPITHSQRCQDHQCQRDGGLGQLKRRQSDRLELDEPDPVKAQLDGRRPLWGTRW